MEDKILVSEEGQDRTHILHTHKDKKLASPAIRGALQVWMLVSWFVPISGETLLSELLIHKAC